MGTASCECEARVYFSPLRSQDLAMPESPMLVVFGDEVAMSFICPSIGYIIWYQWCL